MASSSSRKRKSRGGDGYLALPSSQALVPMVLMVGAFVCLVLFLVFQFSGSRKSTAAFADVQSAVLSQVDVNTMQSADNQMIRRLYGLDPSEFENLVLYYPLTNMGAEELFLASIRSPEQKEAVAAAIEKRLATQKKSFEGYGPAQSAMLEKSIVDVRESYALFISADDPGAVARAFQNIY